MAGELHCGEACAVAGDTVAEMHIAEGEVAGVDGQPHVAAAGFEAGDLANCTDNSCKHILSYMGWANSAANKC